MRDAQSSIMFWTLFVSPILFLLCDITIRYFDVVRGLEALYIVLLVLMPLAAIYFILRRKIGFKLYGAAIGCYLLYIVKEALDSVAGAI